MKRVLGSLILLSSLAILTGCKTEQKNRNDAYVPGAQQCVTNTDPSCTGQVTASAQLPLPQAHDPSKSTAENSIFGKCEMQVEGESKPRPCAGIQLIVRSSRENETRAAVFNGANFRFEGLAPGSYELEANSKRYKVTTDTKVLTPGHTVKIRVRAKKKR